MKVGSLFSGIGGFDLGLECAGMQIAWQCELDQFCLKVLRKHWPDVPKYGDIRELRGCDLEPVDLICGGFPCQPFSVAGKRRGKEDDRYLWPEMFRIIQEARPSWVLGENVAGIVNVALDTVLSDLESAGYSCQTFIIPACSVGAPHRRDRVWVVAYSGCELQQGGQFDKAYEMEVRKQDANKFKRPSGSSKFVADPSSQRLQITEQKRQYAGPTTECDWWELEPDVGRVAHGIPHRVDRLRGLGNAVVPQIVEVIGRAIMRLES